jgi:HSP20 family protein
MSLVKWEPWSKWDPWREIEDMFDRYNRAIGRPIGQNLEMAGGSGWTPRVDIAETDKAYQIKMEIPEVKKEDVKISVDNGMLMIRGERHQEKEEKGKKFHRVERYYGSFARSFALPENVEADKINASFKDGLLALDIPKAAAPKSKAIEVTVH